MSWEVCVGWMDGSRLMRVEIELGKLLFHFSKPVRAETTPKPMAACGVRVDPVPILGQREQGAPSLFFRHLQNMPLLCLTLHGLVARCGWTT
jgi:hypothetical protein